MEINKQLFEDVLSGKLKGTFVLRNGYKCNSSLLRYDNRLNRPYIIENNGYYNNGLSYIIGAYEFDIIDFIPDTNMKEELTIEIPDGKVVDWDESKKQNKIVLKDNPNEPNLSYGDVCRKLFGNQQHYHIIHDGHVEVAGFYRCDTEPNAAKTMHQLECILAKNKLANVAKYLNDGWKPDKPSFGHFDAWVLYVIPDKDYIGYVKISRCSDYSNVLFKSSKLAQQAIEILGKETIKLALEPLGI